MVAQLTFNLFLDDRATFANYFVGQNVEAVQCLESLVPRSDTPYVYLWGASGVGRSHLLQACCHRFGEQGGTCAYLPLRHWEQWSPDMFEGMDALSLVCVDDVQTVLGQPDWERALFNFFNASQSRGQCLVVASDRAPTGLESGLPDVTSRLASGLIFQLHAMSDDDKQAALTQRASARGLDLPDAVGHYMLTHYARDPHALFAALDKLDAASLKEKRKLTVPFVRAILGAA